MLETDADLVYCNMATLDRFGMRTFVSRPLPLSANTSREALLIGSYGADSTWLIKSEKLNNFFQYSYRSIDWATAMVNFPLMKVESVTEKLYLYRKHSNQMTSKSDYQLEAFNEIYPLWLKLNNSMNLPSLGLLDAATISFPQSGGEWSTEIQNWSVSLVSRINTLGEEESKRFEAIIGQRVFQSILRKGINTEIAKAQKYLRGFLNYQTRIHF
jgi:hypothetical protein